MSERARYRKRPSGSGRLRRDDGSAVIAHTGTALVLLTLAFAEIAPGQSLTAPNSPPAFGQNTGEANVALQGYYLGGNSLGLSALSGAAISFRDYVPQLGLFSGNIEGYDQNTQGKLGDNFLQLKGFLWEGRRWTFTGGDFRVSASPVTFPF